MNFLQKGLAGLESRLDKVLLDEQSQPQSQPQPQQPQPEQPRHSSPARTTMQERLAAAVSAKKAAGDSPANGHEEGEPPETRGVADEEKGAAERRLAEAQAKIALLLEEGEKLSRGELKLRNTVRELRGRAAEEEKGAAEARRRAERAEREAAEARERARRAAEEARRDRERVKGVARLEGEVQALRGEREGLLAAVAELNGRVEEGARRAEEAEGRAQTGALEAERARGAELAAEVQRVRGEAAAVEGRLSVEVADLKSKILRDAERARSMELEMKAEQAVMERKMEALRARAEEVSSGASGDAHAKLLRQVETLQTQYAIASENWQGIEGSMLARIAGLEKERDELTRKEADIRRKARDLSIKSKNLDMDLETANSRIKDLESDLAIAQQAASTLQARLKAAEGELSALRSTHEHERAAWQRDLDTKLHEERQKWGTADSRPSSPLNLSTSTPPLRKPPAPPSTTESYFLGATRKPSRPPSADPAPEHPPRRGFTTPPTAFATPPPRPAPLPMPPAPEEDDTDYFANIPFSPRGDMVSVSTVAAGPSVQLVERMSAAVRRLESEMAGARDEAAAITAQRDDARREIVELVREVEDGRGRAERIAALEAEVAELRRREEAMLQLLGEKSELVEELKADVVDLKGMYRDLVSGFGK